MPILITISNSKVVDKGRVRDKDNGRVATDPAPLVRAVAIARDRTEAHDRAAGESAAAEAAVASHPPPSMTFLPRW